MEIEFVSPIVVYFWGRWKKKLAHSAKSGKSIMHSERQEHVHMKYMPKADWHESAAQH